MESVILMKFGELSYFGSFFDFCNVFGNNHPFGLGPEVKGKLGEIRSLLEKLGGTWRHPIPETFDTTFSDTDTILILS